MFLTSWLTKLIEERIKTSAFKKTIDSDKIEKLLPTQRITVEGKDPTKHCSCRFINSL